MIYILNVTFQIQKFGDTNYCILILGYCTTLKCEDSIIYWDTDLLQRENSKKCVAFSLYSTSFQFDSESTGLINSRLDCKEGDFFKLSIKHLPKIPDDPVSPIFLRLGI